MNFFSIFDFHINKFRNKHRNLFEISCYYCIGLILDDYMANFFMDQLAEYGVQDLTLHHRAIVHDISFGMVAMHEDDKTMLGSFFKSNNDNRELMAKLSLQGHDV